MNQEKEGHIKKAPLQSSVAPFDFIRWDTTEHKILCFHGDCGDDDDCLHPRPSPVATGEGERRPAFACELRRGKTDGTQYFVFLRFTIATG